MKQTLLGVRRTPGFLFAFALALLPATAQGAADSSYPNRLIRIVVPYPAGVSANDVTARLLAPKLAERLGQQILIDNRPGASGTIGADFVAKSTPDGYTLMVFGSTLTVLPNAYKDLPFDAGKDLQPITMAVSMPLVIIVNAGLPVNTIKEFIAHAKAKPGQITFGAGGKGSLLHLAGEMLKSRAGIDMNFIPYKGATPATAALLSGELSLLFIQPPGSEATFKNRRVKVLAVTGMKRTALFPEVPTMDEAGVPGFDDMFDWFGFFAPAKTPYPIVQKLYAEFAHALQLPDIKSRFTEMGTETVGMAPEEFTRVFQAGLQKWANFVREAGLKLD